MNIQLVSLNYSPELTGIGKYNGEMCPWFVENGDSVTVVCAPPYYPEWKVHDGYQNKAYPIATENGVTIIRCPIFVPKKPTTLKRLLHLASFALSSAVGTLKYRKNKPDVIVLVEPTLFTVPFFLLYSKIVGCKSLLHIQDYEVDAMLGLGMAGKKENLIIKVAYFLESWLMKKFDRVSTISFSMIDKAISKGVSEDKILFFPNWADTSFVTPSVCGIELRKKWGFSSKDKVILYAGNIGMKQGLEIILEAAKRYKQNSHIKFVLVGSGAYCDVLKKKAESNNLENVFFKPLLPWEKVPEMLALADVHLVIQKKGAADSVLPSKLTNILSAGGNAVVTAEKETELGKLSLQYPGIYSCVAPENTQEFCAGLDEQLEKYGYNKIARKYAEENLNKDQILSKFRMELHKLCS